MTFRELEAMFTPSSQNLFMQRDGKGRTGTSKCSQKKLCFVATDKPLLVELLYQLSQDPNCYFVKYSMDARDGMFLGRCFMVGDELAAHQWMMFRNHPRLMCTIQDDDFTAQFRLLPSE